MSTEIEIRPNERILFLEIPDIQVIIDFARRAASGVIVGLGDADAVHGARRAAADLDNVMFVPATPDDIPWRDGFFTLVVETQTAGPDRDRVEAEIRRVLAPGGRRISPQI